MTKNIRKILKRASWLLLIGVVIYAAVIVVDGLSDEIHKADVMVVLGNKVETTGEPSWRLQARLDRAYEVYQMGYVKRVIVSGGKGIEGFEEADVMADYLVEKGVANSDIIIDREGNNTYMTASHTRHIMARYGFESVLVVSTYYHIRRCRHALHRFGIKKVYSAKAMPVFAWRDFYSVPREMVGLLYYWWRDYD